MTDISERPNPAIPHVGDSYYPSGIPLVSDTSSIYHNVQYTDDMYNPFWVIYTTTQANQLIKLVGYFAPYVPLLITGIEPPLDSPPPAPPAPDVPIDLSS